jgi:hypothetical protein
MASQESLVFRQMLKEIKEAPPGVFDLEVQDRD